MCREWIHFHPRVYELMSWMINTPIGMYTGNKHSNPDPGLWGAGLSLMVEGDFLDAHIDASVHGKCRNMSRTHTAILFLNDVKEDAGGILCFWGEGKLVRKVIPEKNKLVIFENSPFALHSVTEICRDVQRMACSVFYYESASNVVEAGSFSRARFFANPDGVDTEEKKRARLHR